MHLRARQVHGDALRQGLEAQLRPARVGGKEGQHIVNAQGGARHAVITQAAEASGGTNKGGFRVAGLQGRMRRLRAARRRLDFTGMQGERAATHRRSRHGDFVTERAKQEARGVQRVAIENAGDAAREKDDPTTIGGDGSWARRHRHVRRRPRRPRRPRHLGGKAAQAG